MKRFILTVLFFLGITSANAAVFADVMPYYVSSVSAETIGVYQTSKDIYVYSQPSEKSKLLLEAHWNQNEFNCKESSLSNLFFVFVKAKDLAFLTVTDLTDGWVEVIYNRSTGKKGWVKCENSRYLNLRNFYNIYGSKYGLYLMKDAPEKVKSLRASTSEDAKVVDSFMKPEVIKFTVIKGNWALVTVMDVDKTKKVGYLQWRDTNGEIYAFPDIN